MPQTSNLADQQKTPILADFVELNEIATELGKHPRTIMRWAVPYIQFGRRRLYHRPAVREWLLSRMQKPGKRRAAAA